MQDQPIFISEIEATRLRALLEARTGAPLKDQRHLEELLQELDRAHVLEAERVPADVITLRAHVRVRDVASGQRQDLELVLPEDADLGAQRISVLAPLGTALLGYREGHEIEWRMPGGLRRLHIERVIQPATAVHYDNA